MFWTAGAVHHKYLWSAEFCNQRKLKDSSSSFASSECSVGGYLPTICISPRNFHTCICGAGGLLRIFFGKKKRGNSQRLWLFSEEIPSAEFLSSVNGAQFLGKKSQRVKPLYGVKDFVLDDIRFLKWLISQCCPKQVGETQGFHTGDTREKHPCPCSSAAIRCLQELSHSLPVFSLVWDKKSCSRQWGTGCKRPPTGFKLHPQGQAVWKLSPRSWSHYVNSMEHYRVQGDSNVR